MASGSDKQDKINELIHRLRGSTDHMDEHCDDLGLSDMDDDVCAGVDAEIFCCTFCGWWCGQEEEASEEVGHDEWICQQCAEENF